MNTSSHTLQNSLRKSTCLLSRKIIKSPVQFSRPQNQHHAVADASASLASAVSSPQLLQPTFHKEVEQPRSAAVVPVKVDTSPTAVRELSPEDFHVFIAEAGADVVIVDFYTDWCGPCKVMSGEFAKMTGIFKHVHFAKFNLGKHDGPFTKRLAVTRLPTFRFYQNGRIVDEVHGARPQELRQLLVHHNRPSFALHPLRSMDASMDE